MKEENGMTKPSFPFYLEKWYLDFVNPNGEAMIFYSARLTIGKWSARYTSWLNHHHQAVISNHSRFTRVQTPQIDGNLIFWSDPKFGVSGSWEAREESIKTRLFESSEGHLDWECHQPASLVRLNMKGKLLEGTGYAEKLTLAIPPWKIPMDWLRWGRYISPEHSLVWIEISGKEERQWIWLNGSRQEKCLIGDHLVVLEGKGLSLHLDQAVTLESERKISSIGQEIIRYIPGFNRAVPVNFLMANECKWLSKGEMHSSDGIISTGNAIHESVDFKSY